ncbi:MAG TPA: DUF3592 domain-containing protein [Verrucomicrobiae bacterium]|nr:DUF3592 domain-containing protein [Verrucomicrobiae bacterium]
MPRRQRRPLTRSDYWSLLICFVALLILGLCISGHGLYANHRDRPSLQWPKISGTVLQCQSLSHSVRRNSYYTVDIRYRYVVDGHPVLGRQIMLWNPDLRGNGSRAETFAAAHPAQSAIDVFYDPKDPAQAVLVPGADEIGNWAATWVGIVIFACSLFMASRCRKRLAALKAAASPEAASGYPRGFVSYEPNAKRKLNAFPDRDALEPALGNHDARPAQEWQTGDRVIDADGHEFRLVKTPARDHYDLVPTGGFWTYGRLLAAAEDDLRLLKRDPLQLHLRIEELPLEKRMAALIQSIDEFPAGPRPATVVLFLFLVLFLIAIVTLTFFVASQISPWMEKHLGH